jgi:hypothetical protein
VSDKPDFLQDYAAAIAKAFEERDLERLATLTPDERAIQSKARWELHNHIAKIWAAPELRSNGHHPGEGGYEGVAALHDLTLKLTNNADNARHAAGDDHRRKTGGVHRGQEDLQ